MRRNISLVFCLWLGVLGAAVAFYPVDLTTELDGLDLDVQTSTMDTEFQAEKITLVHFKNNGTVGAECRALFKVGVQQPKTVVVVIRGGEKRLARHVTLRDITKMRVLVQCKALEAKSD